MTRRRCRAPCRRPAVTRTTFNEIQTPGGIVVREYTSAVRQCFCVAWQGRSHPDLRQVLGANYNQIRFKPSRLSAPSAMVTGPLLIQQPGLIVQMGGHMRSLTGRAHLPQGLARLECALRRYDERTSSANIFIALMFDRAFFNDDLRMWGWDRPAILESNQSTVHYTPVSGSNVQAITVNTGLATPLGALLYYG